MRRFFLLRLLRRATLRKDASPDAPNRFFTPLFRLLSEGASPDAPIGCSGEQPSDYDLNAMLRPFALVSVQGGQKVKEATVNVEKLCC